MKHLPKLDKSDWQYVNVEPDKDFDPERNKIIIDETIRLNNIKRRRDKKEFKKRTRERNEALASYLKYIYTNKSNTKASEYFGKRYLSYLRGREILETIKDAKEKQKSKAEKVF